MVGDQVDVAFRRNSPPSGVANSAQSTAPCFPPLKLPINGFFRQRRQAVYRFAQIVVQTIRSSTSAARCYLHFIFARFPRRIQHRFCFQNALSERQKTRAVETFVRPEMDAGAVLRLPQVRQPKPALFRRFKRDVIDLTVAARSLPLFAQSPTKSPPMASSPQN